MSIYFNFKDKSGKELHALNRQWGDLNDFRRAGANASLQLLNHTGETFGINKAKDDMSVNNLRIDEMYRLVDGTATGEDRDWETCVSTCATKVV